MDTLTRGACQIAVKTLKTRTRTRLVGVFLLPWSLRSFERHLFDAQYYGTIIKHRSQLGNLKEPPGLVLIKQQEKDADIINVT